MLRPQARLETELVLADLPERQQLRQLELSIEQLRDAIASVDLEIETLRGLLNQFEHHYHGQLASSHRTLRRVQNLVRHLESWAELLHERPGDLLCHAAARLEKRRQREIVATGQPAKPADATAAPTTASNGAAAEQLHQTGRPEITERLRAAYRELARRYHPDLTCDEQERVHHSRVMAHVNLLYRSGDLPRLLSLCQRARGATIDIPGLALEQQIEALTQRLSWFEGVLHNLQEERLAITRSPTYLLWQQAEAKRSRGENLIAEVCADLSNLIQKSYRDVRLAVRSLEGEVEKYNRANVAPSLLRQRGSNETALELRFDPQADKKLIRLGLEQINLASASSESKRLSVWLEQQAESCPPLLRLVLFAYVADLSPFPLTGLETYDDLALRMQHLAQADTPLWSLEETLVHADHLVEYGVRHATATIAHVGLRLRNPALRHAVALGLQSLPMRREFKRVLAVLGERTTCKRCDAVVFAVPLYRTRGIDHLRACVCPQCGAILTSYWMPRGKDIQAVLNPAFLDYDIVVECTCDIAGATVAMQFVPVQLPALCVGDLKSRLMEDLFLRYQVAVGPDCVQWRHDGQSVPEHTAIQELDHYHFTVDFLPSAPLSATDAVELLRHRIRNRFKASQTVPGGAC